MIGEVSEVIDIIKKNGDENSLGDPVPSAHLVEEMADVLIYYHNVLLCYGITEAEAKQACCAKFEANTKRW